jgi:hypothetical protein
LNDDDTEFISDGTLNEFTLLCSDFYPVVASSFSTVFSGIGDNSLGCISYSYSYDSTSSFSSAIISSCDIINCKFYLKIYND